MLATGRIVVDTGCVSYREGFWWIHDVLATGRIVVDTGCVSYREMWWIQDVLATGRCGGYRVC